MNILDKITLIPICCVCNRVRDDQQSSQRPTNKGREQWMSLSAFLLLHRIAQDAYKLSQIYCPRCLEYIEQLGFDQVELEKDPGQLRATSQAEIRGWIASAIDSASECDLETLVLGCSRFSWNQVFLEVDHMSRAGLIRLTRSIDGRYRVSPPILARPERMQVLSR